MPSEAFLSCSSAGERIQLLNRMKTYTFLLSLLTTPPNARQSGFTANY
jgi:hypothetical protein